MNLEYGIETIRRLSVSVTELQQYEFNYKNDFIGLAKNIQFSKSNLLTNSVHFILADILDKDGLPRNLNYAGYFELIVIGEFENRVRLVEEVAQSLTNFYIETEILPSIRPINKEYLTSNMEKYEKLLKKTTKLYDREKSIF